MQIVMLWIFPLFIEMDDDEERSCTFPVSAFKLLSMFCFGFFVWECCLFLFVCFTSVTVSF